MWVPKPDQRPMSRASLLDHGMVHGGEDGVEASSTMLSSAKSASAITNPSPSSVLGPLLHSMELMLELSLKSLSSQ